MALEETPPRTMVGLQELVLVLVLVYVYSPKQKQRDLYRKEEQ